MIRVREKVRLAKRGEQPGFFGLGKYDADVYYLDIKKRASLLKEKLKREEKGEIFTEYREQKHILTPFP